MIKAHHIVQLCKIAQNSLDWRKHKFINIQFQPEEYVLNEVGWNQVTQNKTKLEWTGPYQVAEITADNVYRMNRCST